MATKKVVFHGSANVRELNSEDLKKAGVEGFKKTSFPRREPVEVEAEVANALIENSQLFGKFGIHEDVAEDQSQLEGLEETDAPATGDASTAGSSKRAR